MSNLSKRKYTIFSFLDTPKRFFSDRAYFIVVPFLFTKSFVAKSDTSVAEFIAISKTHINAQTFFHLFFSSTPAKNSAYATAIIMIKNIVVDLP